ncbi:MAG: T9SS type A sorting domain-containing protein, partial [Candidatus Eisenbacteria bacterium]|nr:T9SS type A sorting domain-containing protein [Candidatus Eisenbacteria bacterium]
GPVTGDQLRLRLYSPGFHHENDKVEGTMFTKSGPSWTWVESGFTGIERGWNILSFPVASIHDANDLRELGVKLGSHHYVWDDLYVDNVTLGDTPYPNRYVFLTPDLAFFSETPGYDTKTVSIYYDDGGGATPLIRGFSLEIHYPSGCALVTSAAAGDLLLGPGDPTHFEYDDDGAGTLTIDWLILGQTTGAGGAGKLATVTFTAASEILDCCDAVSFNVSQCRFRDPDNIPITNLVYVGGGVSHDITPPVAAVPASPTHTAGVPTSIDDLKITWATTHDPDLGLYHCPVGMRGYYLAIDQNPSGAPDPQGAYDWFTPWSPDSTGYAAWFQDLPEGDWYVHIVAYDWLWNPSTVGHFGPVSIDKTPPGMVSGFDADITDEADRSVDLAWTNPGDADLAGVEIYRLGTAGALGSTYPEYDDDPNWAVPAWPATKAAAVAAGWTLVGQFPGTGHVDQPAARDYYYYVAFAYDGAGNYSGADAGSRDASLCYWLGDFNGTKNPNYFVDIQDVLIISLSYNRAAGHPDYNPVCDIGPTVDWGRKSLPATDNEVEFEDMIILALNYEYAQGGRTDSPPAECSGRMTAYLAQSLRGDLLEVRVLLADNPGCLKGASVELAFGSGLEYIDAAQGSLWSGGESFFIDSGDGSSVLLDAFALHGATGADGCHAIARFRVRGEAGDRSLRITEFRARSTSNSDIAGEWSLSEATDLPLPATHALFSAMPNPTVRGVTIGYALASETQVAVRIYDAAGRLVRTLVDEARPAGHAQVSWDGLRADGSAAGPGIYFYRMEAGDYQSSRKLTVLR